MPSLRPGFCFGDFLIILIALVFVLALFAGFYGSGDEYFRLEVRSPEGNWRYDLPALRRVALSGSAGPFVVIINGHEVTIEETHCPDKSCARMGPLGGADGMRAGGAMICIPQRIEVTVYGHAPEVDSVCY